MLRLGRIVLLLLAGSGVGLPAAGFALAGAWTQSEGEGLAIVTIARRAAPVAALAGGPADTDGNISQVYLEFGVLDGLTIGAKAYSELSLSDPDRSAASLGGFLRKRVWRSQQGEVASVQAGYAQPIDALMGSAYTYADPGAVPEAHAAGLYGRGWGGIWGSAFLSTGAAYHWRGEGQADEMRLEATGGYASNRSWMGMLGLFGLAPLADGTDASLKVAPSIAYTLWPTKVHHWKRPHPELNPPTIQLGISYDLLNRGDGLGVSVSIWRRF